MVLLELSTENPAQETWSCSNCSRKTQFTNCGLAVTVHVTVHGESALTDRGLAITVPGTIHGKHCWRFVVLLELLFDNADGDFWSCLNSSRKIGAHGMICGLAWTVHVTVHRESALTECGLATTVPWTIHAKHRWQFVVLLELFTDKAAGDFWSCLNC